MCLCHSRLSLQVSVSPLCWSVSQQWGESKQSITVGSVSQWREAQLAPAERSQLHHICQSWVEPQISELESGRVICLCLFTHQPFLQCLMELVDFNDFMCFTFGGLLFGFVSSGWFSSHWVITVSLDQGLLVG